MAAVSLKIFEGVAPQWFYRRLGSKPESSKDADLSEQREQSEDCNDVCDSYTRNGHDSTPNELHAWKISSRAYSSNVMEGQSDCQHQILNDSRVCRRDVRI